MNPTEAALLAFLETMPNQKVFGVPIIRLGPEELAARLAEAGFVPANPVPENRHDPDEDDDRAPRRHRRILVHRDSGRDRLMHEVAESLSEMRKLITSMNQQNLPDPRIAPPEPKPSPRFNDEGLFEILERLSHEVNFLNLPALTNALIEAGVDVLPLPPAPEPTTPTEESTRLHMEELVCEVLKAVEEELIWKPREVAQSVVKCLMKNKVGFLPKRSIEQQAGELVVTVECRTDPITVHTPGFYLFRSRKSGERTFVYHFKPHHPNETDKTFCPRCGRDLFGCPYCQPSSLSAVTAAHIPTAADPREGMGKFKPGVFQVPKAVDRPSPTEEQLASPLFEAIWQVIKTWDISRRKEGEGLCRFYSGANGSDVVEIMEAVQKASAHEIERELTPEELMRTGNTLPELGTVPVSPSRHAVFMSAGPPWYGAQCKLKFGHPGACEFGTKEEAKAEFYNYVAHVGWMKEGGKA